GRAARARTWLAPPLPLLLPLLLGRLVGLGRQLPVLDLAAEGRLQGPRDVQAGHALDAAHLDAHAPVLLDENLDLLQIHEYTSGWQRLHSIVPENRAAGNGPAPRRVGAEACFSADG